MATINEMISSYQKHKNLKISAAELGMSFQTLYYHLRKAGVSVTGDKERYGTDKDKFAAKCEKIFSSLVPDALDKNLEEFQSKIDFTVYGIRIDVKGATIQKPSKSPGGHRWMFSIKKQLITADFFVLFGFELSGDQDAKEVFLIPAELIASKQSISISCYGKSKWHAYSVNPEQLASMFREMKNPPEV